MACPRHAWLKTRRTFFSDWSNNPWNRHAWGQLTAEIRSGRHVQLRPTLTSARAPFRGISNELGGATDPVRLPITSAAGWVSSAKSVANRFDAQVFILRTPPPNHNYRSSITWPTISGELQT